MRTDTVSYNIYGTSFILLFYTFIFGINIHSTAKGQGHAIIIRRSEETREWREQNSSTPKSMVLMVGSSYIAKANYTLFPCHMPSHLQHSTATRSSFNSIVQSSHPSLPSIHPPNRPAILALGINHLQPIPFKLGH